MTPSKNGTRPKQELREFKFVVQPVLLLYEDDEVPREVPAEPKALTGLAELQAFVDAFPAELANINASLKEATP